MIGIVRDATPPFPPSPQKIKFAAAIHSIIVELEKERGRTHALSLLHQQHQIKRRRLYDITNVFTAVGCATRSTTEDIRWEGINRILPCLKAEKEKLGVANYATPLSTLFPPDNCVGLTSLTVTFIMLFAATDSNVLNMCEVSAFFSRDVQRYKTTLSKLYQITLILGALEITERTETPGEVRLRAPFDEILGDGGSPWAIESLLNRSISKTEALNARREEFRAAGALLASI
jgi:hypothetical protein